MRCWLRRRLLKRGGCTWYGVQTKIALRCTHGMQCAPVVSSTVPSLGPHLNPQAVLAAAPPPSANQPMHPLRAHGCKRCSYPHTQFISPTSRSNCAPKLCSHPPYRSTPSSLFTSCAPLAPGLAPCIIQVVFHVGGSCLGGLGMTLVSALSSCRGAAQQTARWGEEGVCEGQSMRAIGHAHCCRMSAFRV